MNDTQQGKRPEINVFCGVQPLSRRLALLSRITTDTLACNELDAVVGELALLDAGMKRLQHERDLIDECDIDQAIDRLRRGPKWGA